MVLLAFLRALAQPPQRKGEARKVKLRPALRLIGPRGNEGLWHFVKYKSQADKKIFFVDYASQSDLKIFFVKYKSQAGWRNSAKKHLIY